MYCNTERNKHNHTHAHAHPRMLTVLLILIIIIAFAMTEKTIKLNRGGKTKEVSLETLKKPHAVSCNSQFMLNLKKQQQQKQQQQQNQPQQDTNAKADN